MANESPPCIVLVEDDEALAGLMTGFLRSEGYEVVPCRQARAAEGLIRERGPDLVIVDLHFPGEQDGPTLVERLADDAETASIPLLICTAATDVSELLRALPRRGGIDVLAKPFDLDELVEKVAAAAGRGRP